MTDQVGIYGFGRFGQLLHTLLQAHFDVQCYDPFIAEKNSETARQAVLSCNSLFVAVPINQFSSVIESLAPQLHNKTTLIDVCSVKEHPVAVMKHALPEHIDIIATHPLFGPDSFHKHAELKIMMHCERNQHQRYETWKAFFSSRCQVIEMSPSEHDRYAAKSQSIAHFLSRVLSEANIEPTPIDTLGFKHIIDIIGDSCRDSWELFLDLEKYNRYSKDALNTVRTAFEHVYDVVIHQENHNDR